MLRNALFLAFFCTALHACAQEDAMLAWGKVLDAATNKGIRANIHYSSIPNGSIYGKFQDSTFSFPIFGVVRYKITAEAKGYNPRTVIVDPREVNEVRKVVRNIVLTPAGEAVALNHLLFSKGRAHIEPASYSELDEVVEMMKDNQKIIIQLEGHTENVGDPQSNLRLSQERVDAVKKYIVSKGISKNRVKTKSFGGTRPLTNELGADGKNPNRRVEMRIISQ